MDPELEAFKVSFVRNCKELLVEPAKSILDRISVSNVSGQKWGRYTLNLSSLPLSTKTCEVLSKLFVHDSTFSEINLSNCSLTEAGIRALCLGLMDNLACRKLNLTGNSIRGEGVACVGRMIRNTLKLHSLCLDWNSVGLLEKDFIVFCEGLGGNKSIHVLDLQNNQVTPQGAQALSESLKANDTLKCLDLRFNHVGLIGGRALLSMLKRNKTICKLLLDGNDIPRDVLAAIESSVSKNALRSCSTSGHCSIDCAQPPHPLMTKETYNKKYTYERLHNLSDALDERKKHVHDVSLQLAMKTDDLVLSEERLNETKKELKLMRSDYERELKGLKSEWEQKTELHQENERRLAKEITELSEKKYALENKMAEVDLKGRIQEERFLELKQINMELENKLKLKQNEHEEALNQEKQKHKNNLNEAESLKMKELDLLKKDRENAEKSWKEEKKKLEAECQRLESQLKTEKAELEREKVKKEAEIQSLTATMKVEEKTRHVAFEKRFHEVEKSRDDLQASLTQVQGQNSQLKRELEAAKMQISELQQELANGQKDKAAELSRMKSENEQKIRHFEQEIKSRDGMLKDSKEEILKLKNKLKCLKEMDIQHSTTLQLVAQNLFAREPTATSPL